MINFNILIKESNAQIDRLVRKACQDELNTFFTSRMYNIKTGLQKDVLDLYYQDKTTDALINGPLNAHFGFVAGKEEYIVSSILDVVIKDMEFEFKPFKYSGEKYSGGLTVKILNEDFKKLLNLSVAYTPNKNDILPWLDWLLTKGNAIIITDFKISFGVLKKGQFSRSQEAIMIPADGDFWKVPAEFAGTPRKNWLTKVLTENMKYIQESIVRSLEGTP